MKQLTVTALCLILSFSALAEIAPDLSGEMTPGDTSAPVSAPATVSVESSIPGQGQGTNNSQSSFRQRIWDARKIWREAKIAARSLPKAQRQAARKVARKAYLDTLAQIRADRKAANEDRAAQNANDASAVLDQNAASNEAENEAQIASASGGQEEAPVEEVTQNVLEAQRAPAFSNTKRSGGGGRRLEGVRVNAQ